MVVFICDNRLVLPHPVHKISLPVSQEVLTDYGTLVDSMQIMGRLQTVYGNLLDCLPIMDLL